MNAKTMRVRTMKVSERKVVRDVPILPIGAPKTVDAPHIVALHRGVSNEMAEHARVINANHLHVEDSVEEILTGITHGGKAIYIKRLPAMAGPNGSPGAPLQTTQVHGITGTIDWDGWIRVRGVIKPVAGAFVWEMNSNNLVFGSDVSYFNATTVTWRSDWNATTYRYRPILEYQYA